MIHDPVFKIKEVRYGPEEYYDAQHSRIGKLEAHIPQEEGVVA
jgi:hypothetical protein